MAIKKLKAKHFRNLSSIQITPSKKFNLIFGDNGSGKTSLLESIYVLGFGRSFRCNNLKTAIQYQQPNLLSCVQVQQPETAPFYLGFEKGDGRPRIKVAGKKVNNLAELTQKLPVLFISPDSFGLLVDGPEVRRKFLDWGTFHCETGFAIAWQAYSKTLRQRNALIKQGIFDGPVLRGWERELVILGEKINAYRQSYLEKLMPCFLKMINVLMPFEGLTIDYWRGWAEQESLAQALDNQRRLDIKLGYTSCGPQRADLLISLYEQPASQLLSRGQQKMLVCALYLAQGQVLATHLQKQCVYLVDDLSAELDLSHRMKFIRCLSELGSQCFISGIEKSLLLPLFEHDEHQEYFLQQGKLLELTL